ncbi:40S ribosomal protein S30 [Culex quinquefasciatus]|uniref:40S ribosomal protein S30 n=1 Tax=Culex quinquefasciatus TaxID=7176 RepID=B0XFY5_CULQU|nr:40S ribosomal protein S30 [Culex quinquefasciatus]|eukprot:XP_001868557.1 40S ribosomal protein S30 [Culex quinquefasciatus]
MLGGHGCFPKSIKTPDQDAVAEVGPRETIQDVKVKFAALECIEEPAQLVLSCEGMLLAHDSLVSALGSVELDLTVPLLGGKVHGSLARAGNVKGSNAEDREKRKEEDRPCQAPHPVQPQLCQRGAGLRSRGPNANST